MNWYGGGMIAVIISSMFNSDIAGSDNFQLLSGEDFLLLDGSNFLLLSLGT